MNLSLSVEDTNKLRAQVGLKLIPIDNNVKNQNGKSKTNGTSDIRISVQETNQLRKRLGLKLIPIDDTDDIEENNYKVLEKQRQQREQIDDLRKDINNRKNELKIKQRMERGGILTRIENSEKKNEVLDFDTWLEQVGKEIKNDKVKKLSFKSKEKKSTDKNDIAVNVNISHDKKSFEKLVGNGNDIILTAKDINVLDDNDDDVFENTQLKKDEALSKAIREKKNSGKLVELIGVGNDEVSEFNQLQDNEVKKRKLETLHLESSDDDGDSNDFNTYDETRKQEKKISKFIKRDVSKFKKSKRNKTEGQARKKLFDTELVEKDFKPVLLVMDDENEDDELDQLLSATRKTNLMKKKVAPEANFHDEPEDKVHDGEVLDENIEFLENIKVPESSNSDLTEDDKELQAVVATQSDVSLPTNKAGLRYKAMLDSENEKTYNTYGVSTVLNALKSGTESKAKSANTSNEIQLVYTDDDGKVLNTKEAYKYLSHKFHGSKKK